MLDILCIHSKKLVEGGGGVWHCLVPKYYPVVLQSVLPQCLSLSHSESCMIHHCSCSSHNCDECSLFIPPFYCGVPGDVYSKIIPKSFLSTLDNSICLHIQESVYISFMLSTLPNKQTEFSSWINVGTSHLTFLSAATHISPKTFRCLTYFASTPRN